MALGRSHGFATLSRHGDSALDRVLLEERLWHISPQPRQSRFIRPVRVFSQFDRLAEKYRLEKIKTIGDAYMVAGGMPDPQVGHAADVANMALEILDVTRKLSSELHEDMAVRIGIHTGPAVAGVIGTRKLFYDVWGDTVNTASRMESHGSAGKIQVTEDTKRALGEGFQFERRGTVEVRGKGEMELYYLTGRTG